MFRWLELQGKGTSKRGEAGCV